MAVTATTSTASPLSALTIRKSFGAQCVLDNVNLEVEAGELVCLLGPSGCGKTTLLRIVAGLERQDSGRLLMGLRDISLAPPQARDYGILFQSYALFPNLTVEQNVAYGLSTRRGLRGNVRERAAEMLELVGLHNAARKYPGQLSGGQQQRVAMARALAPAPALLLLDEPMSALDAKVRERLRGELRELQKRLGITTIMVTHDQDEAMVMADRIAVMNGGRIEQFDSPENLYRRPATPFVADFIGHSNWLDCQRVRSGEAHLGQHRLAVSSHDRDDLTRLFCRPEAIHVSSERGSNSLPVRLLDRLFLGNRYRLTLQLKGSEQHLTADAPCLQPCTLEIGQPLWADLPREQLQLFAKEAQ